MLRLTIILGLVATIFPGTPLPAQQQTEQSPAASSIAQDAPAPEVLPADPLQRCATKALRGDYDPVPVWKLNLYRRVIERGLTVQGKSKRTTYCPQCSGRTCADGSHVRPGIVSASPNIPMHAIVWLATDGILKVCDRGGWVKVGGRFTRRGEAANFDVWVPDCAGGCWTGPGTKRHVPWAILK